MRSTRLPLATGVVLALAATLYFAQPNFLPTSWLIGAHLLGAGILTATLLRDVNSKSSFIRSSTNAKRRLFSFLIAVAAVSWLVVQSSRLVQQTKLATLALIIFAVVTFLVLSFYQDEVLPTSTRLPRVIDGFLLGFVVLGFQWIFVIGHEPTFSNSLLVSCFVASAPLVSALLFVVYSQKKGFLIGSLGILGAVSFSIAWFRSVDTGERFATYWDLVALAAVVAFASAFTTKSRERVPSPLLPLLTYLLGIVVIALGVIHAASGPITFSDVVFIASVGVVLILRQAYSYLEHRRLLVVVSQHENQMRHLAMHDLLTSLPNRTLFQDRLEHAVAMHQRNGGELTLVYIDINDFKTINDEFGHHFGDELLVNVARRLSTWVRPSDTVARLGGDEFVVLMESGQEGALRAAERLAGELSRPYEVAGRTLVTSASLGLYTCSNWDGELTAISERIVNLADRAMHQAKSESQSVVVSS